MLIKFDIFQNRFASKKYVLCHNVSLDDMVGNDIEIVSHNRSSLILTSKIGKTCILDCSDTYFMLDNGNKVKIIDVNEDWLKVEYIRRKDNLISKEKVVKLIDMSLVNGIEIVGDEDE